MKLQSLSNTEAIKAAEILINYLISENCSNLSLISEIAQIRDQAFRSRVNSIKQSKLNFNRKFN